MNQGLKLEEVRQEVLYLLGHGIENPAKSPVSGASEKPRFELGMATDVAHRVAGQGRFFQPGVRTRPAVLVLAWLFLALGFVGLCLGILGREDLTLPSVVLIGFCLIALAVARR